MLPDGFPRAPGAYAMRIVLAEPLVLDIHRFAGQVLGPGHYVYCGSANGPGGLRARLARHLRADKALHWHVDGLTGAGEVVEVHTRIGGAECELMRCLLAQPGVSVPLAGFGASDCRACPAHLAAVSPDFRLHVLG